MIEVLKDFADNVAAFAVHGDVTKADYETVLVPYFEDKLTRHKKVRIYCAVSPDFAKFEPGAIWADSKLGLTHFFDWERCALVSDVEWVQHVAKFSALFGFLWPGEYRAYSNAEADKAREWIAEP